MVPIEPFPRSDTLKTDAPWLLDLRDGVPTGLFLIFPLKRVVPYPKRQTDVTEETHDVAGQGFKTSISDGAPRAILSVD
jgi:hypothetical protein